MKQQIKQFARKILGPQRTQRLFGAARSVAGSLSETNVVQRELAKLAADPTNPALHRSFAEYLLSRGRLMAAFAELRTAKHLGMRGAEIDNAIRDVSSRLPPVEAINHNRYYRLKTLADEIIAQARSRTASVLDVGGGDGALAQFIPLEFEYCLAEPKTNGISGERLPFAAQSFDVVTSCHVLEHVPADVRPQFLDMLLATARSSVVLLNPFANPRLDATERMEMLWDITRAPWVHEHRDCGLPTAVELEDFARQRGLEIEIKPNGSIATSVAIVLMEHYAKQAGRGGELQRINQHFNQLPLEVFDSRDFPNALIVTLRRDPSANSLRNAVSPVGS